VPNAQSAESKAQSVNQTNPYALRTMPFATDTTPSALGASHFALILGSMLFAAATILCFVGRKTLRHFLLSLVALLLIGPWPIFLDKQR